MTDGGKGLDVAWKCEECSRVAHTRACFARGFARSMFELVLPHRGPTGNACAGNWQPEVVSLYPAMPEELERDG
jgi:hypothetical protein